jgi:hypothetical protein
MMYLLLNPEYHGYYVYLVQYTWWDRDDVWRLRDKDTLSDCCT